MRKLLIALTTTVAIVGPAHAVDFCREPDGALCHDENGKVCYKLSDCCKGDHDWATQHRDGGVCKKKPRKIK